MSIPLLDLNRQYNTIKNEIQAAINEVLESQHFIMGDSVTQFEDEVSRYCESDYAYGCASGSDALLLALMAMDVQPGDYVITTPFTFFATAGAISRLQAIPVFLDIEKDSYNLDPKQVDLFLKGDHPVYKKLDPDPTRIKAVIPVHLYGQMADMDPIIEVANKHGLMVIEDAAQAIGATYKGQKAGSMGDFGCFSFFPSKNLGAYGDAGLITVKNAALAEKTDILRTHGARPKYHHSLVGINSRLDAIQANILSVKLKYLEEWSEKRRAIAYTYNKLFREAGIVGDLSRCMNTCTDDCGIDQNSIITPIEITGNPDANGRHIYHQYTLRTQKREMLIQALNEAEIGYSVYYPVPLHEQECFSYLGYEASDCPNAHCASKQVISLPIFPELKEDEIRKVANTVISAHTS